MKYYLVLGILYANREKAFEAIKTAIHFNKHNKLKNSIKVIEAKSYEEARRIVVKNLNSRAVKHNV